ncbi:MAG: hypothetical protein Q9202_001420 [Teloschistes flavicans]
MSSTGNIGGKHNARPQPGAVHYPFWFGGSASCCAAAVTHPLDLDSYGRRVQVRLQTRGPDGPRGMLNTFIHILKTDGPLGLYSGLSASLLRQLTYSTTRFGIYETLKPTFTNPQSSTSSSTPALPTLLLLASTSGLFGGIAGNPADVLNVRMQHDPSLPAHLRRGYTNALDGLVRMTREEGLRSLFRGVVPNSMRAVLMTASQLASYDAFKSLLLKSTTWADEGSVMTHLGASLAAGFVATTVCSPVDVIKTRVMSSADGGKKESLLALLRRVQRAEGAMWMWRGWVPSFVRLGPHTVATFLFLEQHKKIFRRLKGGGEGAVV